MKPTLFAAAFAILSLAASSLASAQTSSNVNLNRFDPQLSSQAQRAFCQVRPSRACVENLRAQPGSRDRNQRGGQQGGNRR